MPTPVRMRVSQTDPPPIPTRRASAPHFSKSLAASGVAIFPAITSNEVSKSVANDLFNARKSPRICFIEE